MEVDAATPSRGGRTARGDRASRWSSLWRPASIVFPCEQPPPRRHPPDRLYRGRQLTDLGWGEPHQYEDFGTEFMIYGPRSDDELDFVLLIIEESLDFARGIIQGTADP